MSVSNLMQARPQPAGTRPVARGLATWGLALTAICMAPATPAAYGQEALGLDERLAALRAGLEEGHYRETHAEADRLCAAVAESEGTDSLAHARALDVLVESALRLIRDKAETREIAERARALKESLVEPDDPELALSLLNLAWSLQGFAPERAKAIELLDRARQIREAKLGGEDPAVAEVLRIQGYLLLLESEVEEAASALERALAIQQGAATADPVAEARILYYLAYVEEGRRDLERGQALHERTLALREEALRADHPEIGWSLHALGAVRMRRRNHDGLRPSLERAAAIMEATYGSRHRVTTDILGNLAILLDREGDLEESRALRARLLAVCEARGDPPLAIARQLHDAALLVKSMGDLAEARTMYERALAIMEEVHGGPHRDIVIVLNALGVTLVNQGLMTEARAIHERALAMGQEVLGPEHRLVAHSHADLAEDLWSLGDRAAARVEMERALEIIEATLKPDHPDRGYVLTQLGSLLAEMGEFEASNERLQLALSLRRGTMTLSALAKLHARTGDPARAVALEEEALASREERFGPEHPDVALSLVELAAHQTELGRHDTARSCLERALPIREATFGTEHPEVAEAAVRLAEALWSLGDRDGAFEMALRGEASGRRHLELTVRALSERQALGFATERDAGLGLALSAVLARGTGDERARVWDTVIRSRALVLDEMAARNRSVGRTGSEEIERLAGDLARARERLAHLVVLGPDAAHPERYGGLVERAGADKERAELALAEKSGAFRRELERARAGWDEVSAAVPRETALVSYVRFLRHHPPAEEGTAPAPSPAYAALVLRPRGTAVVVSLGTAGPIEELVAAWREAVSTRPPAARAAARRAEARYRDAGAELRAAIWDPLAGLVGEAKDVLIVPDGDLHLVSFAALPADETSYLVESGPTIHLLSSERDLVRTTAGTSPGQGLLALGDPDFDAEPGAAPEIAAIATLADGGGSAAGGTLRGGAAECEDFRERRVPRLPASSAEVDRVAGFWTSGEARPGTESSQVIRLVGPAAHEAAVKRLAPGRRVVHLATHGFFVSNACSALAARDERGVVVLPQGDNPLLLSGLALAGFNRRHTAGQGVEDGVLTAEEIASLDLRGVEWVVLSACETGLGEVRPGEGVFGLRRAFEVAGADTLIMSLWAVQDEAARRWMQHLYEARAAGLTTSAAVRRASVATIDERRRRGRSTHPFWWGAFVAAGDSR